MHATSSSSSSSNNSTMQRRRTNAREMNIRFGEGNKLIKGTNRYANLIYSFNKSTYIYNTKTNNSSDNNNNNSNTNKAINKPTELWQSAVVLLRSKELSALVTTQRRGGMKFEPRASQR
ncbi:unnamed protein product [Ceratitis capitata]|uniref:(Mediterranean fruit fly) hypothetical protein n=1 Tax=Ceratitis capitata TaxID=7213 RepID=A0A811UWX7_CERCA|nr:unnamed protein product [Ceratitis capitata]